MKINTKTITITEYIAEDGTIFDNEKDCVNHDKIKRTYFRVLTGADLTEGRGYMKCMTVKVSGYYGEEIPRGILMDYLHRTYGDEVGYIQGTSAMMNYIVQPSTKEEFEKGFKVSCGDYSYPSTKLEL